jgi:hypothetical protein
VTLVFQQLTTSQTIQRQLFRELQRVVRQFNYELVEQTQDPHVQQMSQLAFGRALRQVWLTERIL